MTENLPDKGMHALGGFAANDVAVLGFERADKEGRGHFVGSLDVDSGRSCAGGTLTEILCDSRLGSPLVVAENAVVAFHILDN